MAKYKLGLVSFKLGALAADGDIGTSLTAIGDTVAGTAKMDTTEANITDFKIEESDSPVLSIKTEADKIAITWSTYDNNVDTLIRLFGGTKTVSAVTGISVLGAITAGSGYSVPGVYVGVPLTGGTGTGATADITVAGGIVTAVALRAPGTGYAAAASLSCLAANIGGSGTGFAVVVTSVATIGEKWLAPDAIPEIELSLRGDWKQGGFIEIPRAKIVAKLSMSFKRDALSQIDITATVLQPTKAAVPRMTVTNGA